MRVFKYLPTESLATISEVSKGFHRLATHASLYRHHLKLEPTDASTPPAQLFRRLEGLHYPAETIVSVYSSAKTVPFCVVNNTLVLLDLEQSCVIRFPSGERIQPADSLDSAEAMLKSLLRLQSGKVVHVVLPGGHFGFMHEDIDSPRFTVVNVDTGAARRYPVHGGRLPTKDIMPRTELIPAGENAEWVAYHTGQSRIALIDWRTGTLVREIELSGDISFVAGECPHIRGSSLVGLAQEEVRGVTTTYVASMFDGVVKSFNFEHERVLRVLRSADKKTFVFITNQQAFDDDIDDFGSIDLEFDWRKFYLAIREEALGEKRWSGELLMDEHVELRENGRLIHCRVEPFLEDVSTAGFDNDLFLDQFRNKYLWIELKDDGTTSVQKLPTTFYRTRPIWTRRVRDGTLGLFVGKRVPQALLLKFVEGDQTTRPTFVRLEHWTLQDIASVFLVGEHYLVVGTKGGSLLVRHFNHFCRAHGVLACPGAVEARDEDDDLDWTIFPSSRKKKRRAERF